MKKYFKIASFAIIAAIRVKKSLFYSLWRKYQMQLKNIIFFPQIRVGIVLKICRIQFILAQCEVRQLIYLLIQKERINAWCQAVCAKSLTHFSKQQLHNIIDFPKDKEKGRLLHDENNQFAIVYIRKLGLLLIIKILL
ncbi:unnamed protein product (macronuclear) [Paramecium tetraurelia]|uniref:Uncharacterized protein n=1 Tax=Paramecium tetraurelia TaxID=5888 RepID=A0D9M4_PARTE|nr:uncharacterized protein GSPATT00014671001 [Paramecium tetraurelia]CAK79741.1 unnamed protein product [Paramecium tetraurelia]|eukprot:XP_001447138.1 hypothetical protein (macronuclear) [Paramecium tetraurelia strain d4-2]